MGVSPVLYISLKRQRNCETYRVRRDRTEFVGKKQGMWALLFGKAPPINPASDPEVRQSLLLLLRLVLPLRFSVLWLVLRERPARHGGRPRGHEVRGYTPKLRAGAARVTDAARTAGTKRASVGKPSPPRT
jgi:hypothetical protein